MAELSGTRRRVLKALRPLDAIPIENKVGPGTPDVNCINCWIELKWLPSWPKRASTPVRIEHYTQEQRDWALIHRHRGRNVWWLLQVGREWVLLDGAIAATRGVGRTQGEAPNKAQLMALATRCWINGLNDKELLECVSQDQRSFSLRGAARV